MNKERAYLYALGLLVLSYFGYQLMKPQPVNWNYSFVGEDTVPFGTYIMREESETLFPGSEIEFNTQSIFDKEYVSEPANWVFINYEFEFDQFDAEILFDYVIEGDNVFIAAYDLSGYLGDTLGIIINHNFPSIASGLQDLSKLSTRELYYTNPAIESSPTWRFPRLITSSYIGSIDSIYKATVLSKNDAGFPVFMKMEVGEGAFFIHTSPFTFTNYFMRDLKYYGYASTAISYLPDRYTVWDEYYKSGKNQSRLSFILSNPNLKSAWFLGLFGILIFMIFEAKRRQRIIPILKPPVNTSIKFAETIGNLHLLEGTHKKLFKKKQLFFLEYIRKNLNLNTGLINNTFIEDVSSRSGLPEKSIKLLFDKISDAEQKEQLSAKELKKVCALIDQFYKNSKR